MNRNLLLLIVLILLTSCSNRNERLNDYADYYRNYNKIQALIDDNKIPASLDLFENSIQTVDYVPPSDYFEMSRMASKIQNCDLAKSYFTKAMENGFEYDKVLQLKKRLNKQAYKKKYEFDACQNFIQKLAEQQQEIQYKFFNKKYKAIIDSLFQVDQDIRGYEQHEHAMQIDSNNIATLLALMKSYGYPSSKIVGHKTSSRAYIILLHFDQDYDNKILKPILDKAYHDGFLSPTGIAWIVDRRRNWGPKELDPYYFHIPAKVFESYSLQEKQEVNLRRDSIGLKPIQLH